MSKEKEAKETLKEIEKALTCGKGFRKYSRLDLVRFARMHQERPDVPIWKLVEQFNEEYPDKSASEKLENLKRALEEDQKPFKFHKR